MKLIEDTGQFFKKDIWHVQISKMPWWKALFYRILRILLLTYHSFRTGQIQQGASALTYYSLLAVVPIIALLIGIARGFLFEKSLELWLLEHFSEQQQVVHQIFKYANASLEQAKGGLIAGIGVLLLGWAAIKILMNLELVMNQIWEIKKGRTFAKKFTDYLAMIFLAPVIVFLASGLTGYISALLSAMSKGKVMEQFVSVLIVIASIISFLLISLLFSFLYIFIPNTRVRFIPGLIAGLFAAIVYQLLQWIYFYFQIGVASYNAIYGTFAAFPLFLVWLHLSWVIILIGAKLCFAIQNAEAYEFMSEEMGFSHRFRLISALRIAHLCIKRQDLEQPAPCLIEISNVLSMPLVLTRQLTEHLVAAGVLVEIKTEDQEETFQPAKSAERLTIKRVIDMINNTGAAIPLPPSPELNAILQSLEKFSEAIAHSKANILLKDV